MGNVSTTGGRQSLSTAPGFKELLEKKKAKLIASIQSALKSGETGITISYLDLLVDNPNKDVYDDYLIEPTEVKKIMNEIIGHPYTVENNKVMTGNVIFYNMSFLKILFVFGIPLVAMPLLPVSPVNEVLPKVEKKEINQKDQWHSVDASALQQLSDEDISEISN
jgi:hypothetical protein